MKEFTVIELQSLERACYLAYRRKDLELRRVRRNKDLIEEGCRIMHNVGLAEANGMETFEEQVESAKAGKAEFLHLKHKIQHLLRFAQ